MYEEIIDNMLENADESIIEETYENGKPSKTVFTLDDGTEWIYHWTRAGWIDGITSKKNGKMNGLYVGFYRNGNVGLIQNFKNGVLSGLCQSFTKEGKLKSECEY